MGQKSVGGCEKDDEELKKMLDELKSSVGVNVSSEIKEENSTDSAEIDILSEVEKYTIESVEYDIKVEDRSYKDEKGEKLIDHYYDKIVIVGDGESISDINKALQADMDKFFFSQSELEENSIGASSEYPYYYTCDTEVTYNKNGFFSVKLTTNWCMGGVSNEDYYGLTFNLNTGKPATLEELIGKSSNALETELKSIVWNYLNEEMYEELLDDVASKTLEEYKLEEMDFHLNDGEIVLTFPTYTFASGAAGPTVVNTGIYINE